MTILILSLALAASALAFAFALYFARGDIARLRREASILRTLLARTEADLRESEDFRDAVKRSALRGAPLVKWHRDLAAGLPTGADVWYWRIRISGGDILLTDEQYEVAKRRADFLLSYKPQNPK